MPEIVAWIIRALIAVCVFFLAQWLMPLLFGIVHVSIPDTIVNILALLIAIGVFWYWSWGPAWPSKPAPPP